LQFSSDGRRASLTATSGFVGISELEGPYFVAGSSSKSKQPNPLKGVGRKTFAEFFLLQTPEDEERVGKIIKRSIEVPPGDRDPLVPRLGGIEELDMNYQLADIPIGVRFFDLVVAVVLDPLSGIPVECVSKQRLDEDQGTTFYSGVVVSLEQMQGDPFSHENPSYINEALQLFSRKDLDAKAENIQIVNARHAIIINGEPPITVSFLLGVDSVLHEPGKTEP
jgi:hypothetical protein